MRALREAERAERAYERSAAMEEKERRRLYVESRVADVAAMNEQLTATVEALQTLLQHTLNIDDFLDFDALKEAPELPPFQPGALAQIELAPVEATFLPSPLGALAKLKPGAKAKHEQAVEQARAALEAARRQRDERERKRKEALSEAREKYEREIEQIKARVEAQDREIDDFRARFEAGDPTAIVEYFSLVLDSSHYPDGFPHQFRIAFVPESKQLVVEYELPPASVVPGVRQFKYVKARDAIDEAARPTTQVRALYAQVVAQTTLRTIHELFEADRTNRLDTIVFNGFVNTIDPATGQPVRPHLVTVRASKDSFVQLDLARVEPLACLKGMNASVSKSPTELLPVRPILEFNMVDRRFVQESDVLGALDERPNLMELSPTEFESLISNLFEKMGLETRQTQASRDGGVDCVAYDPRPIFGGKVIHPGEALQKHRWRQRCARSLRHDAERRRLEGHPRHDEWIREIVVRVRRRQAA